MPEAFCSPSKHDLGFVTFALGQQSNSAANRPDCPVAVAIHMSLQEIKAVDRLFPALDQVEMQLACRHVLDAVSNRSDNGSIDSTSAALQLPASQSIAATVCDEPMPQATAVDSSHNGSQGQEDQPAWLQQRDDLDEWILENLNDGPRRLRMVQTLTRMATPFRYGASKVLQALGDLNSENVS